MDGTLFRFHDTAHEYIERMWEPGFYRDLKPFQNFLEAVRSFISRNHDTEVYILSAVLPTDPPFAEEEKRESMHRYLPEIPDDHMLFVPAGADKSAYIGEINGNCYLIDDYNKNLREWAAAGGCGIKFINDVNNKGLGAYGGEKGQLWNGAALNYNNNPLDTCLDMEAITGILPYAEQRMNGFKGDVSIEALCSKLIAYSAVRKNVYTGYGYDVLTERGAPNAYKGISSFVEAYTDRAADAVKAYCTENNISTAEQACLEACYTSGKSYGISIDNLRAALTASIKNGEWHGVLPTPNAMHQFIRQLSARDRALQALHHSAVMINARLDGINAALFRPDVWDFREQVITCGCYVQDLTERKDDLAAEYAAVMQQWEQLTGTKYPNVPYKGATLPYEKYKKAITPAPLSL